MQQGLAHVCLISGHMTIVRAKLSRGYRKRGLQTAVIKRRSSIYNNIMSSIERHMNFDIVKCVLLASPGFVKDDFFKHMMSEASRRDVKSIAQNKDKFVLCHSSGYKHALKEVLADPGIQSRLADTKAAGEVKALIYSSRC